MTPGPAAHQDRILTALTPVFRAVFEDDALVLSRELDARQVPGWDSLAHITLVVELESFTGVTFTTDDLVAMANVGDLVDCLLRKGYAGGPDGR